MNGSVAPAAARVVQVIQGEAGLALSEGFRDAWRDLGQPEPKTIQLTVGKPIDHGFLRDLIHRERPSAVLLWTGASLLDTLRDPAGLAEGPIPLVISAGAWKGRIFDLPDPLRSRVYITYPYRHPKDEARALGNTVPSLAGEAGRKDSERITSRMYSLVQILSKAFMDLDGAFYRDHLLDRISMLPDQSLPDYERLSFGPGQRYASKGCYIMQLTTGADPELVKRSDWVIH